MSLPLDGGPATLIATTTNPTGLASDGVSVVWTSAPLLLSGGFFGFGADYTRGSVSKLDLSTGTQTDLYASPSYEPDEGRIALDTTDVYWVTEHHAVMKTVR